MKKVYKDVELEVIKFESEDVITESFTNANAAGDPTNDVDRDLLGL